MRQTLTGAPISIGAGKSWPGPDEAGVNWPGPFSWMRVHNRTAGNDVAATFGGGPASKDPLSYDDIFIGGERRVRNFGDPALDDNLPTQVHLTNLGATTAILYVEVADSPIVDLKGS